MITSSSSRAHREPLSANQLCSGILTVPEGRDAVMALPFIPCVLPLMSILVVLLGGVASACGVLPGGTVDDTVDDVLILMMEAVRLMCTV